jgi:hypothetical protein
MSIVGGWLLAPLVLAVVCCGLGLLVEVATGVTLPGGLVPAVGLAGLIVLAGIPVAIGGTARLAVPLVAAAAAGGIVLGEPWRDPRLGRGAAYAALLAVAAYAVYSAPSLLSGQGSIVGYIKLDDSATWLATVDRALGHGRDLRVAPSSYGAMLRDWLGTGYPVGGFLPLGVAAHLSGQDLAAAYQSTISVFAAILALGLWTCVRSLVRTRWLAAAVALIAVQASLLLGYAQWGGIKELCSAALLPPAAWLAARSGRALLPLAIVVGALCGVLSLNGLAWGAPALAIAIAIWVRGHRKLDARLLTAAAGLGALLAVAALPALTTLGFTEQTTSGGGGIANQSELGNLFHPLRLIQGAGIWPVGDFRFDPDPLRLAMIAAIAVIAAAAAATVVSSVRRSWPLVTLMAVALAGTVPAVVIGSPWVDAKALAVLSPVPLLAAAGLVALALEQTRGGVRAAGAAVATALVALCAWSTIAIARDVYVAPRARLAELRDVGRALRDRGPSLQLDFDVYGDRWFLRDAAPEGATDLREREVHRATGGEFPPLSTADVDDVATADLWAYRTIVRRRSPVASRPPGAFRLTYAGRYWEVWERAPTAPQPLAHVALGEPGSPAAHLTCSRARALARTPGARTLGAVPRQAPILVGLDKATIPSAWRTPAGVRPVTDGVAATQVQVPVAGGWRLWVGGPVLGQIQAEIDGRPVGAYRHELAYSGQWLRFASVALTAGPHTITLRYRRGPFWRSGRGAASDQLPLERLALSPQDADGGQPVVHLPVSAYGRLCGGGAYDWVEAER